MSGPCRAAWRISASAAVLLVLTLAARADAIDGDWCQPESGQRLSIRGPEIVTPGGARLSGDYQRHFFRYVVPGGEPSAGATVQMRLLNETQVELTVGEGAAQQWVRCSPSTS